MEAITRRQKKIKSLVKMLYDLQPYVRHAKSCKFSNTLDSDPDSDFCTCGLSNVVKKVNFSIEEAKEY